MNQSAEGPAHPRAHPRVHPRALARARRLVPEVLLHDADVDDAPPAPRSRRDVTVDWIALVLGVLLGALFLLGNLGTKADPISGWEIAVDSAAGALACAMLWWRRPACTEVALATAVLSAISASAAAPAMIALFTVAVHRRLPTVALVTVVNVAAGDLFPLIRPQDLDYPWALLINLIAPAILVAWGMFVRARRQLISTLRERAERAEAEQRILADRARLAERTRIAREMHDVLAHRISLVALHAGGLELQPDLPAGDVQRTARLLRDTAHAALEELRGVIGVLRERDGEAADHPAPSAPQPSLADIARLVAESRAAGGQITYTAEVPVDQQPPGTLGRDAYRIVQEALTNVAKHARGTATVVRVTGSPGSALQVSVRNLLPLAADDDRAALPGIPGSGSGLQERVVLAGGTLRHGPTGDGAFVVAATFDWPLAEATS